MNGPLHGAREAGTSGLPQMRPVGASCRTTFGETGAMIKKPTLPLRYSVPAAIERLRRLSQPFVRIARKEHMHAGIMEARHPAAVAGAVLLLGAALYAGGAFAAIYYVDPATGNDANPGLAQTAPWRTIPGTRNLADSGWLRTSWGGISSASKLKPGDVIEIKAGTTMNSAAGGRLHIDGTYYENGLAGSPITIRVSATWGTGPFTYDLSGMTITQWLGGVQVAARSHIAIEGADSTRRFVVANAKGKFGLMVYGAQSSYSQGVNLDFVEVRNSAEGGLNYSWASSFSVSNSSFHDNGTIGMALGYMNDDKTDNGQIVDSVAYNNGRTGTGRIRHGFGLYGATNITYLRCKAYNNGLDGFDFGTATNGNSHSAMVVNSVSYGNGEDGFGLNGTSSSTLASNLTTYINTVSYGNTQAGWYIYGGATAYLYHVIAHHNGSQTGFGGNWMINSENPAITRATIKNSIGYKPRAYANVYSYNAMGAPTYITSDHNLYVPRAADTEVFAETPWGTPYTYSKPPSWVGPNDKIGIASDPRFVSVSTTSFSQNDYHVSSTSPARGAGVALSGSYLDKDAGGVAWGSPRDIGLYSSGGKATLLPPTNLRVVQ